MPGKQSQTVYLTIERRFDERLLVHDILERFQHTNYIGYAIDGEDVILHVQSPRTKYYTLSTLKGVVEKRVAVISVTNRTNLNIQERVLYGEVHKGGRPSKKPKMVVNTSQPTVASSTSSTNVAGDHNTINNDNVTNNNNDNVTNNNVTNNIQVHIHVNAYGSESLDHITTSNIDDLISSALRDIPEFSCNDDHEGDHGAFMAGLVKLVHEPKCNRNVKCYQSKRDVRVMGHDGRWKLERFENILERLPTSKYFEVIDYIQNQKPVGKLRWIDEDQGLGKDERGNLFTVGLVRDEKTGEMVLEADAPVFDQGLYEKYLSDRLVQFKHWIRDDENFRKELGKLLKPVFVTVGAKIGRVYDRSPAET